MLGVWRGDILFRDMEGALVGGHKFRDMEGAVTRYVRFCVGGLGA